MRQTIVTFTGTRWGMTKQQQSRVRQLLRRLSPEEVHHGMCIGADAEFHQIVRTVCKRRTHIHGWPQSIDRTLRAKGLSPDSLHKEMPPLERNKAMVSHADVVIATPKEKTQILRSGTWATIRYAVKKKGLALYVVGPDGKDLKEW